MTYKQINFVFSLFLTIFLSIVTVSAQNWRPFTQEELTQTKPKVEADADAEAYFWEVKVDDSGEDMILQHYVRVKIFTEKGRERFSKVDIPYTKQAKISDIAARVIKPDGTIVELKKDEVFDREIVKFNRNKVKAKSFAVPNIEAGVIVEYRYKETVRSGSANYMKFVFQRDVPIQSSTYLFKPFRSGRFISFNLKGEKPEKDKDGYYRIALTNVPALKEEPYMPPEDEVRSWGIFYYTSYKDTDYTDFWARIGGSLLVIYDVKDTLSPGKDSKKVIEEIINPKDSEDEKLRKIFDYTRAKIRNLSYDLSISDEEREKLKPNSSPEETLKKGQGFAGEINDLFATLAIAAGFEARVAFTGDRSEIFFSRKYQVASFIQKACVAVMTSKGWRYFDPGSPFVPFGMIAWFKEDQDAILLGKKDYVLSRTPLTTHERNNTKRTGNFTLLEDGTLEGDVRIEMTGQTAYQYRASTYEDSASKREEDLKQQIKNLVSSAEVFDIKIQNVAETEKPVVQTYKIRIPGYASKTGKRMFFQPGVFEYGSKPYFSSSSRAHDIYFPYPWSESDELEIKMPNGFELDNAETPGDVADQNRIGSLIIRIGIDKQNNILVYKRNFYFGGDSNIFFSSSIYALLKNLFDAFHQADIHTIALRQKN